MDISLHIITGKASDFDECISCGDMHPSTIIVRQHCDICREELTEAEIDQNNESVS